MLELVYQQVSQAHLFLMQLVAVLMVYLAEVQALQVVNRLILNQLLQQQILEAVAQVHIQVERWLVQMAEAV
jgi:Flp pilus assembly protein protease CpaA